MFSINHYIWIGICVALILLGYVLIKKYDFSIKTIIDFAFYFSIASELIKVLSAIEMVPIANEGGLYPYLEARYFPLHLCSLQIFSFAYLKFSKHNSTFREWLLAFMYPSCILGGTIAILLPSIFSNGISVDEAFAHPLAYQTFLFHTMLILFGIYIYQSKEIKLNSDGFRKSVIVLCILSFLSIYINSIFSTPIYENGKLAGVSNSANFLFTALAPIPLSFNYKWQWLIYLLVIAIISISLMYFLYLPIIKKEKNK